MWNLVTVDGYFEGPSSWDLGFHEAAWGDELERFSIEQLDDAAMLLFGRVTYEGMAAYWQPASGDIADRMNAISKAVFSRTLEKAEWHNTDLVRGDATAAVAGFKQGAGGNLYVFGSAALSASLMQAGLFDEYRICVAPVILGAGNPLFKSGAPAQPLELIEARPLSTGAVMLRYGRAGA
jgi:dihydrofolate reductase